MEELKEIMLEKTNMVFEETLKELKDYSHLLTLLNTYFYWSDFPGKRFSENEAINLLNEATFDLVSSLFNSFSGFYRQGMIALRSSLELTALYVYYFDHPIEFKYFLNEGEYRGPLLSDLIEKGNLLVKKYCSLFIDENKLKKELHTKVKNTYQELSRYVHGRLGKLQTLISFPVNFDKSTFSEFMSKWEMVIGLGNTILAVRFLNEISAMDKGKKEAVYSIIKKLDILEV